MDPFSSGIGDSDELRQRLSRSGVRVPRQMPRQIFAQDLPSLSDAQLVQVLVEAREFSYYLVAGMLAPLARAELARRRATRSTSPVSQPEDFQRNRAL